MRMVEEPVPQAIQNRVFPPAAMTVVQHPTAFHDLLDGMQHTPILLVAPHGAAPGNFTGCLADHMKPESSHEASSPFLSGNQNLASLSSRHRYASSSKNPTDSPRPILPWSLSISAAACLASALLTYLDILSDIAMVLVNGSIENP